MTENTTVKKPPVSRLTVGLICLVGAIVAGLIIWYVIIPGGESVSGVIARAQKLSKEEGQADKAAALLQGRLGHTVIPRDRGRLQLALGQVYLDSFKYIDAVKVLERARQAGADPLVVNKALAEAYWGAQNKIKARQYYQLLLDYYSAPETPDTSDNRAYKAYYAGEIERTQH